MVHRDESTGQDPAPWAGKVREAAESTERLARGLGLEIEDRGLDYRAGCRRDMAEPALATQLHWLALFLFTLADLLAIANTFGG